MDIVRKDPPPGKATGPTTQLDRDICRYLMTSSAGATRPMAIAERIGESTQAVHARLKVLAQRGVLERIKPPGAPANGPGSAFYAITEKGLASLAPEDP